jgi:phosphatidylserine decarboxylase
MIKEGYKFAAPPLLLAALIFALSSNDSGGGWHLARLIAEIVLIVLGLFVLYFFRDPNRTIPSEADVVVSPADGHVIEILDEAMNGTPGRRITIFLSVFDVHVNRSPLAGRIAKVEYKPGRFYAAMRKRASEENEMNVITVATPRGDIVFKQIAGAIARRVICWKAPGASVGLGERIGMIRFGSRVDIWLPMDSQILVRRGQKVAGGSSILARWKSTT